MPLIDSRGSRPKGCVVTSPFLMISTLRSKLLTTTDGRLPSSEYRPHFSPPSTLSRRKECRWSSIFANADTGVSMSASISRYTGIRFPCFAFFLNSSSEGLNIKLLRKYRVTGFKLLYQIGKRSVNEKED